MTERDCDAEDHELQRLQRKSIDKIAAQTNRMLGGLADDTQTDADEQQLLNEMQGNKASIDLNRILHSFECDEDLKDEMAA